MCAFMCVWERLIFEFYLILIDKECIHTIIILILILIDKEFINTVVIIATTSYCYFYYLSLIPKMTSVSNVISIIVIITGMDPPVTAELSVLLTLLLLV